MRMSKKTVLPRLRFPEFSSSREWEETTLSKLANFRRGSFPQPYGLPEWYDEQNGMPFIQVFDVGDDMRVKPETKNKISALASKQSVFIPKGTVIITIQGSIGRVAVTQYDAYIDRTLLLFERFHRGINKIFIAHTLQILFEIEKQKAPGGIIKTITKEVLSDFKVNIPDAKEQQKIADCFTSLDDIIAAEDKKLALLKTHKKGLMQKLFPAEGETVPEWRFSEFRGSGEWKGTTLSNLADFRRGSFPQPYGLPEWYDEVNGTPFIQVFDVGEDLRLKPKTKSKISSLASKQSVFIPKGTLIITIQGSIGRVAITQYDAYIDRTLLLFEKFHRKVEKTFVAYTLRLLFDVEKQKAPGGIIKTITKEVLSGFKVRIPDTKEQQKIADCLSSLDDKITAQTEKIETLKLHKKGLMQGLFPSVQEVFG